MPEIGTTLREARMRARIDITEVEARTKIRARYLRAIENEEWDLLPGPVYVKSFLRTYSDFLGLDSRMLVDEYKRRYEGPSDHDARPIATRTRERERERQRAARGPLVPPWALIGLVLVAIVAALYFIGAPGKKSTTSSTPRITQTQRPRPRRHRRAGAAPAPARRTVTVQLVPTGKVYICLVDASGKKLIPGVIYDAGQTIPAQSGAKLMLTLGNAAVRMKVNGKDVPVTPSATSIGFALTPKGASPLPVSGQPRCA